MKYSLFIGRYQCLPPHKGHLDLIQTVIDEGGTPLIWLRETGKDEKNPYSLQERFEAFTEIFGDKVKIMGFPDIDIKEVCYGRGVGYDIREIVLDEATQNISATGVRKANNLANRT